ncbi:glutathione peroxidase [Pseudoxanthomonas suwonensis]|uniref:glutathione peroxidase n=1 Tax=Pseudoxanthomonas suwonensis TaxID=314722 RepID=UPI00138F15C6|nr:glutathione peroxidase [Pseudoxanthomonas suwonensis]KAF1700697.1 glutathione peroxidase [Pseudoxanthomonas suwonensis]
MKTPKFLIALALLGLAAAAPAAGPDLLDVEYRPLASRSTVNLAQRHAGQVLLVVNTASKCGFTPQYEGLEALQQRYAGRGFSVIGFPSNDFRGQEPGDEAQIAEFCTLTYGVKFPMYEKVQVTGDDATPLYRRLAKATGVQPGWNFHKYLVSRDGRVVANWPSKVEPDDPALVAAIERELARPAPRGTAAAAR